MCGMRGMARNLRLSLGLDSFLTVLIHIKPRRLLSYSSFTFIRDIMRNERAERRSVVFVN